MRKKEFLCFILGFILIIIFIDFSITGKSVQEINIFEAVEYSSIIWDFENESLYEFDNKNILFNNSFVSLKKLQDLENNNLVFNISPGNIETSSERKGYWKSKAFDENVNTMWESNKQGINASINITLNESINVYKIGLAQINTNDPVWNETEIIFSNNSSTIFLNDFYINNKRPIEYFYFNINTSFISLKPISLHPKDDNKPNTGLSEIEVYPYLYNETGIVQTKNVYIENLKFWTNYEIEENNVTYYYSNDSGNTWYNLSEIINKTDKKVKLKIILLSDHLNTPEIDEISLEYTLNDQSENIPEEKNITYYTNGIYDDDVLFFTGDWIVINDNLSYQQNFHKGYNNSEAKFYFKGKNLRIYSILSNESSCLDIYLDNNFTKTMNLYYNNSEILSTNIDIFEDLEDKEYNLTLKHNKSCVDFIQEPYIIIDAIEIFENEVIPISTSSSSSSSTNSKKIEENEEENEENIENEIKNKVNEKTTETKEDESSQNIPLENENTLDKKEILPTGFSIRDITDFFASGTGVWVFGVIAVIIIGILVLKEIK